MIRLIFTSLSRRTALSAILCMVVMLMGGFEAVKADMVNLHHQASGHDLASNETVLLECGQASAECHGHLAFEEPHFDLKAGHHHHSSAETNSAVLPSGARDPAALYATAIAFGMRVEPMPNPAPEATPDQPPRA